MAAAKKKKKYIVVEDFKDLQDGNKIYVKGDIYPSPANKNIDNKRLEALLSSNNRQGRPVIKEVEADQE